MQQCDYVVIDCQYDPERNEYKGFLLRERIGEKLGPYFRVPREQVIIAIRNGLVFKLEQPGQRGSVQSNGRLYLVEVDGRPYIRTDQEEAPCDYITRSHP